MKKIDLQVGNFGGIDCFEKQCMYKSECANHHSAGDFRMEGGLTPILHKEEDGWYCETTTSGEGDHHGMSVFVDGKFFVYDAKYELIPLEKHKDVVPKMCPCCGSEKISCSDEQNHTQKWTCNCGVDFWI